MSTNEKLEKRKKYYLDALRIIAILFVMYNHSPAFLSFQIQSGVEYEVSLFLSMLCKAAVPVFFMISGALLLGKSESFADLFWKRIFKCVMVIVLFSFLYYMKLVLRGAAAFSLISFLKTIVQGVIFLPYWYLYSYLGFLLILPFLRGIAQIMTKQMVYYLILLQLVFGCILPVLGTLKGWWFCGYLSVASILDTVIFYPLTGYGIDRHISDTEYWNEKGILLNLSMVLVVIATRAMVAKDYLINGVYSESYLGYLIAVPALLLFLDAKMLFRAEWLPEKLQKVFPFLGDKVFGMYLLDGFIGTGGVMEIVFRTVSPFAGFLPAYGIEILCIFFIRLVGVTILKKLPVFKSLL